MNLSSFRVIGCVAALSVLFFCAGISSAGQSTPATIVSRTADVGGVKIHYLTAGPRSYGDSDTRLHANVSHVEADHSAIGRDRS